jgi:hypothetical protein
MYVGMQAAMEIHRAAKFHQRHRRRSGRTGARSSLNKGLSASDARCSALSNGALMRRAQSSESARTAKTILPDGCFDEASFQLGDQFMANGNAAYCAEVFARHSSS